MIWAVFPLGLYVTILSSLPSQERPSFKFRKISWCKFLYSSFLAWISSDASRDGGDWTSPANDRLQHKAAMMRKEKEGRISINWKRVNVLKKIKFYPYSDRVVRLLNLWKYPISPGSMICDWKKIRSVHIWCGPMQNRQVPTIAESHKAIACLQKDNRNSWKAK